MAKPIRVRHRSTETEATQWDGDEKTAQALNMKVVGVGTNTPRLLVPTAHGEVYADVGDWVIHSDAEGRPFVRNAKVFEAEFEPI
jgi:hypothetical protein